MHRTTRRTMSLCSHKAHASHIVRSSLSPPSVASSQVVQIVLLRHGESEWNAEKRFSGWMDIDLTEKGRNQATQAGKLLALHGFEFDEAHASLLKRAVRTLWTALHSSNHHWIPVKHSWRLNERHYGALVRTCHDARVHFKLHNLVSITFYLRFSLPCRPAYRSRMQQYS